MGYSSSIVRGLTGTWLPFFSNWNSWAPAGEKGGGIIAGRIAGNRWGVADLSLLIKWACEKENWGCACWGSFLFLFLNFLFFLNKIPSFLLPYLVKSQFIVSPSLQSRINTCPCLSISLASPLKLLPIGRQYFSSEYYFTKSMLQRLTILQYFKSLTNNNFDQKDAVCV